MADEDPQSGKGRPRWSRPPAPFRRRPPAEGQHQRLEPKWLRTLCYTIMLPGLRAGFNSGELKISSLAGRRNDFEALPARIRPKSTPEARFLAREHY